MSKAPSITERVDGIFRTRTLGISARGIPDQYADGKAAKVWKSYIGDQQKRTGCYKDHLLKLLKAHKCEYVLDVACGTGYQVEPEAFFEVATYAKQKRRAIISIGCQKQNGCGVASGFRFKMAEQKVDGVFRTRSLGVAATGIPDQYADGKAAQVWQKYIGDQQQRTGYYKEKLTAILREQNVKHVLDIACGTGVDSVMLLEEGFKVTSCDASDKMLKYALKTRWERRKEEAFDKWVIEEGNWLHLEDSSFTKPGDGFDAIICMGNSFAHLPDFDGNQSNHYTAIQNFYNFLRPGGVLIIDHRNYDHIVSGGKAPMKNIYYQSKGDINIKTSVLMVDGKYQMVTLDYTVVPDDIPEGESKEGKESKFRLSYFPHLLDNFNKIVTEIFGSDAKHTVLADFEPLNEVSNPAYFIHICEKKD